MTTALFEDVVDHEVENRQIRLLALGGALQLIRARRGWSVSDAATHAGMAPMTWRRLEDGLAVRPKSYAAVDSLLELPFGSIKQALNDDLRMVEIVKLTGTDTRHVASDNAPEFLADFARTARSGSPAQDRMGAVQRLLGEDGIKVMYHPDEGTKVLDALNRPRPWRPSDVKLIGHLVELLQPLQGNPPIDELLEALRAAAPLLMVPPNLHAIQEALDVVMPDAPVGYVESTTDDRGDSGPNS